MLLDRFRRAEFKYVSGFPLRPSYNEIIDFKVGIRLRLVK